MKLQKILSLLLISLFVHSVSVAQMSKVTALVKGDAMSGSGAANDVSVTVYKGTDVVNKTKLTPEGKFTIVLQPGNSYKLTFQSGKYYYHEEPLVIPASDKYQEVPMHVMLKELEFGKPYTFTNLIFEPKSSDISLGGIAEMESIAAIMKRNNRVSISATVYPDETPSGKKASAQNQLAQDRKSALLSFFISKNIPASNVSVVTSSNVPATGQFERVVMQDAAAPAKGKKKSKKVPATASTSKKVMVPQNAEVVMMMTS